MDALLFTIMNAVKNSVKKNAGKLFVALTAASTFMALCLSGKIAVAIAFAFGVYFVCMVLGQDKTGIASGIMNALEPVAGKLLAGLSAGVVVAVLAMIGLEAVAVAFALGCYAVCAVSAERKVKKQPRIVPLHSGKAA